LDIEQLRRAGVLRHPTDAAEAEWRAPHTMISTAFAERASALLSPGGQ
jgi:hypothetical protein